MDAAAEADGEPEVSVKHSVHRSPCGPLSEPVVVLVLGQTLVSGYLLVNTWSTPSFCCCAVIGGLDEALPTVMAPAPLGSARVICSLSLESTTHPDGIGSARAAFDAVGPVSELGDSIGLGEPAGVGRGGSAVIPPVKLTLPLLKSAIAVPQPAINTIKPKIAARTSTQGVR